MAGLTIKTNHHWRDFVYRSDVPVAILADRFEHLSEDDATDGFFCYRGWWYHLSDFMALRGLTEPPTSNWDGYLSDSYFSGVVLKVSADGERYMVGTYCS